MPNDKTKRQRKKKKSNKDIRYDEELRVSRHGAKRVRERLGLPKSSVQKNAEKALKYGCERFEASGPFRRYLDAIFWEYGTANNLRVYNRFLYIFCGETLVTVLNIPLKYIESADILQRRKRKKLEEENVKTRRRS